MIKLLVPLPKKVIVACSGGVDSMAVLTFLRKKHDVTCAFFHHGTETSDKAMKVVASFCTANNVPMMFGNLWKTEKPKNKSQEEYWRDMRYKFFDSINTTMPIITCHHLDDCVETYIWSSLHGNAKVIPIRRKNVIRPFLTTRKQEFVDFCQRFCIPWAEDESNKDNTYMRNYIRNEMMPHALKVNPGLHKVVKKMVEKNAIVDILSHDHPGQYVG